MRHDERHVKNLMLTWGYALLILGYLAEEGGVRIIICPVESEELHFIAPFEYFIT